MQKKMYSTLEQRNTSVANQLKILKGNFQNKYSGLLVRFIRLQEKDVNKYRGLVVHTLKKHANTSKQDNRY